MDANNQIKTNPRRTGDLFTFIRGRRSVRRYQACPVEHEQILQLVEAACCAPSPHGSQPWRFAILTQPEPKVLLADSMGATWKANLEMDGQDAEIIAARLERSRQRILQAPALILPCLYLADLDCYPDAKRQTDETTMAIQSLGAAIQNMLLMAYQLGLDTGWMCAPLFCPTIAQAALDLEDQLIPHALITVGYAAEDPKCITRRPLQEMIPYFH
jgi:coenzyme F420-0:L-glutamate ligase / coenzyme F420-1:gamma-L-glutamate ligase